MNWFNKKIQSIDYQKIGFFLEVSAGFEPA